MIKKISTRHWSKWVTMLAWLCGAWLAVLLGSIPVKLAIANIQHPQPQAIFTLGGGPQREIFTAAFAKPRPQLDIWVSTGQKPREARKIFAQNGIDNRRLHLDYRAIDTVTNFTSLVYDFKAQGLHHLYLITADYHMPRAKAVATIILGSQGITFTPVEVPSFYSPDPLWRQGRDVSRALLWLVTRHTGASRHPQNRETLLTPTPIP